MTNTKQMEALIASIVEVTRQRERTALEDCFSRLIVRLTDAEILTIYHLQPKENEVLVVPILHLIDGENVLTRDVNLKPFPLSSNAALAECLRNPYVASDLGETNGIEEEIILPLQGVKGVVCGYCRLGGARSDANIQRTIPLLLEFYRNFLSLLDDNERDTLTGLLNRKTFDLRISQILATLRNRDRENRPTDVPVVATYCLATLDIDHFKRINDTFGHLYGDEVLLLFSNLMRKTFRDNDLLFRFGGEEFVALLAIADVVHASIALERFRSVVENNNFPQVGQVTVSIGIALISPGEMPRIAIDRADKALYFAKQNGRNQVHVYEDLIKQGSLREQSIKPGEIELF